MSQKGKDRVDLDDRKSHAGLIAQDASFLSSSPPFLPPALPLDIPCRALAPAFKGILVQPWHHHQRTTVRDHRLHTALSNQRMEFLSVQAQEPVQKSTVASTPANLYEYHTFFCLFFHGSPFFCSVSTSKAGMRPTKTVQSLYRTQNNRPLQIRLGRR